MISFEVFLIEQGYKASHYTYRNGKRETFLDKHNHSLVATETAKNKYWKAMDQEGTFCVFEEHNAAVGFVKSELENLGEEGEDFCYDVEVYAIWLTDEQVATMPEYNP